MFHSHIDAFPSLSPPLSPSPFLSKINLKVKKKLEYSYFKFNMIFSTALAGK